MNTRAGTGGGAFSVTTATCIQLRSEPIAKNLLPPDAAVEAHWQKRLKETPALFDGTVFVMANGGGTGTAEVQDGIVRGTLHGVKFRTFLYWREVAWNPAVVDAFGSAILISRDSDIILGTAGPETINSGWAYFFGGFLDPRDIGDDGMAMVSESTARELQEETGLVPGHDVDAAPGYIVARSLQQVSFGVVYRSREGTDDLVRRIHHHLSHENDQEIAALKIIRSRQQGMDSSIQPFTAAVIRHLLK